MLVRQHTNYSTSPATKTLETVHVGRTVYVARETVQVMSDIWEDHMRITSITPEGYLTKDTVSGWYGIRPGEEQDYAIDATPQAFADYLKHEYEVNFKHRLNEAEGMASNPAVKGRVVKVVKGRNGKGSVGRVVVVMEAFYGMGYHGYMSKKLGIALSPEKETVVKNGKTFENYKNMVWVWAQNCEVETVEPVMTAPLMELATTHAMNSLVHLQRQAQEYNARYMPQKAA